MNKMATFFLGLCLFLLAPAVSAAQETNTADGFDIFRLESGGGAPMEIPMDLFVGADPQTIKKYLPDGKYALNVSTFLIKYNGAYTLFDAGMGQTLLQDLAKLNVTPEEISSVCLTHMHFDHIGALVHEGKAVFPNAQLYLSNKEKAYWTEGEFTLNEFPETMQGMRDALLANVVQSRDVISVYGDRVVTFDPAPTGETGTPVIPGVRPMAAYGHTPGHTVYLVGPEDNLTLIWGDLLHVSPVQLHEPDISVIFDADPAMAAATRKKVLQFIKNTDVVTDGVHSLHIAGMHLAPPAIGHLESNGTWTKRK